MQLTHSALSYSPPDAPVARPLSRRRDVSRTAVRAVDAWLRRAQRVVEYSAEDACLLRISVIGSPIRVHLSGGLVVDRGDPIIALHFWNEHLPQLPAEGPNFVWVRRFRSQMVRSLCTLAQRAQSDPALAEAKALRARMRPTGRLGRARKIGDRMGFERPAKEEREAPRVAHDLAESVWLWGMTWTFNAAGARRARLVRDHDEAWMPRDTLIARYGQRAHASSSMSQ